MKHFYKVIFIYIIITYFNPLYSQIHGCITYYKMQSNKESNLYVSAINIRAYNSKDQLINSVVTDSMGNYLLDIPAGKKVRIEFDNFPLGSSSAPGQARTQFGMVQVCRTV